MGRKKNDGRGRLGGRQPGSQNKVTKDLKEWITKTITSQQATIEKDFEALESKDRIMLFEKLLAYVVPRRQSIDVSQEYKELERLLNTLPDEAIEAISNKIINLNKENNV